MRHGRDVENEVGNVADVEGQRAENVGDDDGQRELECFDLRLGERLGRDALTYGRQMHDWHVVAAQQREFGREATECCRTLVVLLATAAARVVSIERAQFDAVLGLLDAAASFDGWREAAYG